MEEKWAFVAGFEGKYSISTFGRLRNNHTKRVLSLKNKKGDYFGTGLTTKEGKRVSRRIHRLVAETFVENPEGKPQVNHLDGNKQNNHVSNLEWVTHQENMRHAIEVLGLDLHSGMRRYNQEIRPRPIICYTLDGQFVGKYRNSVDASKATGVCYRNILQVASKDANKFGSVRKQAGGYRWVYADEVQCIKEVSDCAETEL